YLPASLWGELASESNEHQDIIRTMYVRWGLALSQSFERVHSNEPVLRLPDVSMFGPRRVDRVAWRIRSQRNSRRRPPTRGSVGDHASGLTNPCPRQGLGSAALSGVRSGVTVCANPSWL